MAGNISFGSIAKRDGKTILNNTSSTGLDTEALIDAQLAPLKDKIKTNNDIITQNTKKLAALSELRSILRQIYNSVDKLSQNLIRGPNDENNVFNAKQVEFYNNDTSSNNNYLEASAAQNAIIGSYEVKVINLAVAQKQTSDIFSDPTTDVTSSGSGKFATGSFQITSNDPSLSPVSINVATGDNLYQIVNKINEAANKINIKSYIVKASAIDYRLVIQSTKSGVINGYNISDPSNILTNINFTHIAAQDANITFNDINVSNPDNIIKSVIDGLTLNVKKPTPPGIKTIINIENDFNAVLERIATFQSEYNNFIDFYQNQTARKDEDFYQYKDDALLCKDSSLLTTKSKLYNLLISLVENNSDKFNSLGSVGINISSSAAKLDNKGNKQQKISEKMNTDFTKLHKILLENFDEVKSVFDVVYKSTNSNINIAGLSNNVTINELQIHIDQTAPDPTKVTLEYINNQNNLVTMNPEYTIQGQNNLLIMGEKNSPIDGLKILYIDDGNNSSSGSLSWSQGVAAKIKNFLDDILGNNVTEDSIISNSENAIAKDIDSQKQNISKNESNLRQQEQDLTKKYTKLQATLASYEKQLELMKTMDKERRSNK